MSLSAIERSLLYASPHPYLIMSADAPDFTIVAANQAFADLIHEAEAELIGKTYPGFLSNPLYATGTTKVQEIAAVLEEIIVHKETRQFQIEFSATQTGHAEVFPLLDDKNEVKFLVQTFRTEHWNMQGNKLVLDQNSDLLENNFQHPLFNDYPDPVFTIDLHGNFLSANNALLDLAECSKEELLQQSFVPFINPIDIERAVDHFKSAIKGVPQNFNVQDITQRKKYIEKIEAQNRRLLDISWLQSHYVRAPLSQIMALVKVLTVEHSEAAYKESLAYLAQAAEQLDTVIKRIIKNTEGT